MKTQILIILLFYFSKTINSTKSDSNNSETDINSNIIDDWLNNVNKEYRHFLHYSAIFGWNLLTNPDPETIDNGFKLDSFKLKWKNQKCSESVKLFNYIEKFLEKNNENYLKKRAILLLCRGPIFTEYQNKELNKVLNQMSDVYSMTQICLPRYYDVCRNIDHIWSFTYVKTELDEMYPLSLDSVKPTQYYPSTELSWLNDNITDYNDYFVFRDNEENGIRKNIEFLCFNVEPEMEKVMTGDFTAFQRPDCKLDSNIITRWAWESWRMAISSQISIYFAQSTFLLNIGARNAGFHDIGAIWKDEFEMKNFNKIFKKLWMKVKPLYKLLHGVLRYFLKIKYNNIVDMPDRGFIPAHLTGNMWSQNWEANLNLILQQPEFDLNQKILKSNWTAIDLIKRADDFYSSLGLRRMSKAFWTNSVFEMNKNLTNCHGTAANMHDKDVEDYRMIVCPSKSIADFYVIVHEMGHIHYYMLSENQPPIFQDGTNTAFQEAIGDAIFYGIMTPQHLNRLQLISDNYLFSDKTNNKPDQPIIEDEAEPLNNNNEAITFLNNNYPQITLMNQKKKNIHDKFTSKINDFDLSLLLRMALTKIPQIPFEYILDKFRFDYFNGDVEPKKSNYYFWNLTMEEQGISPPDYKNRDELFDIGSKFHFANNIPYSRYYFASFLQLQIFRGLCRYTVFGIFDTKDKLPMPLHRCDIYGSKRAGKLLKKALSLGSSAHWKDVLYILSGEREINVNSILEYYQPLIDWMEQLVIQYNIPIGW